MESITEEELSKIEEGYNSMKSTFISNYDSRCQNREKFTEQQLAKLRLLFHYFLNSRSGELDVNKNLFLFGAYGTGKTTIMETFNHTIGEDPKRIPRYEDVPESAKWPFVIVRYTEIIEEIRNEGTTKSILQYSDSDLLIDDFGMDQKLVVKYYGEDFEIAKLIISHRYEIREKQKTYFTSNLSPGVINKQLGEAYYSRLVEMCNIMLWPGPDYRLRNVKEF